MKFGGVERERERESERSCVFTLSFVLSKQLLHLNKLLQETDEIFLPTSMMNDQEDEEVKL